MSQKQKNLAYIIGVAIGDGNLSNPNGRAVRLRITCDLSYPQIIVRICSALKRLLPNNKVSIIKRAKTYCDISCYSNSWETILNWKAKNGPKHQQNIHIPNWIKNNKEYCKYCLRGLMETDGSIYFDRKYKMVNFTSIIPQVAQDCTKMIKNIGFKPNIYQVKKNVKNYRYTVRISSRVQEFIDCIGLEKN